MGFVLQLKAPQLGVVLGVEGTKLVGGVVGVWWECRLGMFGLRVPLPVMDRGLRTPDTFFTCQTETCVKKSQRFPPLPD